MTIRRRFLEPGALALILLLAFTSRALAQTPVTTPDDPDAILTRALELRRLNRKADALATIERAVTIAPERSDIVWWRDLLEHEVHGWEVTIGGEYREWDETRTPWREAQFTVRRNTAFGPLARRRARTFCSISAALSAISCSDAPAARSCSSRYAPYFSPKSGVSR